MDESLYQKVKNYFSRSMSDEERRHFKLEMETNNDLRTIFDLYKTIEAGIFETEEFAEEERRLRNLLNEVHAQFIVNQPHFNENHIQVNEEKENHAVEASNLNVSRDNKIKRIKIWKNLAIAAITIGIILTGSIWYFQKEKSIPELAANDKVNKSKDTAVNDTSHTRINISRDNIVPPGKQKAPEQKHQLNNTATLNREELETLYTTNFKPDTIPSNFSELLKEPLKHFKDEEYKDAIAAININVIKTSLEEIRPRGEQNKQQEKEEKLTLFYAFYYKALSYMAYNNAEKAISELKSAIASKPDNFFQSKAQWYLALAYIKTGKIKEAKTYLRQIVQTKEAGEYKQKALNLFSELEEINEERR